MATEPASEAKGFPDKIWYGRSPLKWLLAPLSLLFIAAAGSRRLAYWLGIKTTHRLPVPVIVVGNITVGGTGKTPLTIWLCRYLRDRGYRPGIVSRGYGGKAQHWPQQVRPDSDIVAVGDESVLLARRGDCPVCVGPDRVAAAKALLGHTDCNILISDDGLQHYAMARDLEIVVIDGERRFGNGWRLPAGPLRESRRRLNSVDMVVANGEGRRGEFSMRLRTSECVSLLDGERRALESFRGRRVHAVAGIGNPGRFFASLRRFGLCLETHPFADHHHYMPEDLHFDEHLPVLMTEKDAVKCQRFADPDWWYLEVSAQPEATFIHRFNALLETIDNG